MNRWVGMGHLARDPEVRYTQGKEPMCVARYTVAVNRRGKDAQADFITCTAFGKAGEFAEKYLRKGMRVAVEGRIQTGSYKDREGRTVYTTEVVVDNQEFAQSKAENAEERDPQYDPPTEDRRPRPQGEQEFLVIPNGVDESGLPFN